MQTCKLKDITLPINRALENRKVFTQALFTRPESLAALLPYDEFIEEGKIFQLKDGSLGAIFEVKLLEHEPMIEKEILRTVGSLKPWFSLPENCTLQILYDQTQVSKFDEEIKKIESSFPNPHPVSKIVFDEKIKALKDSCGTNKQTTPLKRKTYLSIRYFPAIKDTTRAKDYLKRGEVVLYRQLQGFVSEFRSFQQILKNLKIGSEIGLRQLDASELLDFLRKFFNPKTYYKRTFAPFNKRQPISDQFLYNSSIRNCSRFTYPVGHGEFTRRIHLTKV